MSNGQRKQAEALFQDAVELPVAQRGAFLDAQCGADAALRAAVEALLGVSDATVSSFLRAPLRASDGDRATEEAPDVPRQIGRYRILRVIGVGGMGVVYEAEQEAPHRKVALKLLRPGWLSQSLLRRFAHEEEVLGRLRHPGIAQIYEAGVVDLAGRPQPFFAMELVHGQPLTAYAEQAALGTRQRLELFARVCDALQHAHQHGVIHRDLKPGNILVEEESAGAKDRATKARAGRIAGGAVQPKIIDFGVARVTDGDIALTTMRTDVGQLIGTIAYMSPEQAHGDSRELDTRSDVYALGVILYELLTGRLPHDVTHKPIPEAVRVITEDDPTPISSLVDSAGRPLRHLRGDIETIVARALEKEKGRRYASAAELAADIRHYLADEPIVARPASTLYQLGKFARRHKALCGATAVVFLVLVAATVVSMTLYVRAERARIRADSALRGTASVSQFLKDMISVVDTDSPNAMKRQNSSTDLTVREMLQDARGRVEKAFAGQPLLEAETHATLAKAFEEVGDYAEMELQARAALEIEARALGPDNPKTLADRGLLAWALDLQDGKSDVAIDNFRTAYAGLRRVLGPGHAETLLVARRYSAALTKASRPREAELLLRETLPHLEALGTEPAAVTTRVVILSNLSWALLYEGHLQEAEWWVGEAVALAERSLGPQHSRTAGAWASLAMVLIERGAYAEAQRAIERYLEVFRAQYGPNHPYTQNGTLFLMVVGAYGGNVQPAIDWLMANVGNTNLAPPAARFLAELLNMQARFTEAEKWARESGARGELVAALIGQGRFEEAAPIAEVELQSEERTSRDGQSLGMPALRRRWGQCLAGLGRYEEAEQQLKRAYDGEQAMRGPEHRKTQEVIASLVRLYELWDKPEPAAEWRAKLPATQPVETQP